MSVDQTRAELVQLEEPRFPPVGVSRWRRAVAKPVARIMAVMLVLILAGGGAVTAQQARERTYSMAVAGWGFDLFDWVAHAIAEKTLAGVFRPTRGLAPENASDIVVEYMSRSERVGQLEQEIERLLSEGGVQSDSDILALQQELETLREQQADTRTLGEQIIERQVGYALAQEGFTLLGFPFPPVQFTFTEPPKKLIVSPRDRIATTHSRMLDPRMSLALIEQAESDINEGERTRAYITNIGGLGAYPTMVIDRASLDWILSTVAHEWAHNYLALYPLGWNYFKSQDMTTLNETVAEIVGDETGANVAEWYYTVTPSPPVTDSEGVTEDDAEVVDGVEEDVPEFDFREEMRATRLEVDRLLADRKIDEAEEYMERQRLIFVENGYPLRVLNQAYFAFHGSYGTSAASTSPIGPKLRSLREMTPSLKDFLNTVKWFSSVEDLDAALDQWTPRRDEM